MDMDLAAEIVRVHLQEEPLGKTDRDNLLNGIIARVVSYQFE